MTNPPLTHLAEALSALLPVSAVIGLPDEDLLAAANDVEALGRTIDALRVSIAEVRVVRHGA
jgi:hypothetical protein